MNTSGAPVPGAKLRLEVNMLHPGMAPVFADAKEIEPGRHEAKVELSMAGDWYVIAHVGLPDGNMWTQQFVISGVEPRI